jgi:hypothetical protein
VPERDLPFVRGGYCLVCRQVAHERTNDYGDLSQFFKQKVSTLKTWNSLQNTWLKQANSKNQEIAWRMLQRAVNGRPVGAPMLLYVRYHGKLRAFRPLPPPIAPARWHGCVVAAYFYHGVLLSSDYDAQDHVMALNQRKQGGSPMPGATA